MLVPPHPYLLYLVKAINWDDGKIEKVRSLLRRPDLEQLHGQCMENEAMVEKLFSGTLCDQTRSSRLCSDAMLVPPHLHLLAVVKTNQL